MDCCGSLGNNVERRVDCGVWLVVLQEGQGLNWRRHHSWDTLTSSLCWLAMLCLGSQVWLTNSTHFSESFCAVSGHYRMLVSLG